MQRSHPGPQSAGIWAPALGLQGIVKLRGGSEKRTEAVFDNINYQPKRNKERGGEEGEIGRERGERERERERERASQPASQIDRISRHGITKQVFFCNVGKGEQPAVSW